MLTFLDSFGLEDAQEIDYGTDENGFRCEDDFVQIVSGSVDEKYCGSSMPSPLISSENTMTVVFHNNGFEFSNGNGFRAFWNIASGKGERIRPNVLATTVTYLSDFKLSSKSDLVNVSLTKTTTTFNQ